MIFLKKKRIYLNMLHFLFRMFTIFSLTYYSLHFNIKDIFSVSLLSFLFVCDFISKCYPIYFFQLLFCSSFLVSFSDLMIHLNSFYSYNLFFYNLFLMLQFIFYYNFILIPNQREESIKDYFYQLPNIENIDQECYICLENCIEKGEKLKVLPCSHIFHTECLLEWYNQKLIKEYNCPVCKKKIFQ